MKNRILILGLFSIVITITMSAFWNASGSHGAKTGSPADVNKCTQCHSGTAQTVLSWISTDIPTSGYIAGQNYNITVEGTHAGVARFGFECTSEDVNNAKVGTFTITNTAETKLVNSSHAITHTGNGFTPDNDSTKSWTFEWTAPASGTGNIKFYAALLAANGNMSTSGDQTYLTSLEIIENTANGINNSNLESKISIYPSIVRYYINIEVKDLIISKIVIYNMTGQVVISEDVMEKISNKKLDLQSLNAGNYIIAFSIDNRIVTKRFIKE